MKIKFLTERELRDIDERNAIANRLRTKFGLGGPGESEMERLVAEVRYWRARHGVRRPQKQPSKERK